MPSPPFSDNDLVTISSLNDYLYCPRRCALHQVEGVWVDNAHTVAGIMEHSHVHQEGQEYSGSVRVVRALPLASRRYGLTGVADAVEMPKGGPPVPIEYKHGPRRRWDNDDVQLCAQALCLEEMLQTEIPTGAVFHLKSRRRRVVELTKELRRLTIETAEAVRGLLAEARTPPAVPRPQCEECSVREVCMPELALLPRRSRSELFRVEE